MTKEDHAFLDAVSAELAEVHEMTQYEDEDTEAMMIDPDQWRYGFDPNRIYNLRPEFQTPMLTNYGAGRVAIHVSQPYDWSKLEPGVRQISWRNPSLAQKADKSSGEMLLRSAVDGGATSVKGSISQEEATGYFGTLIDLPANTAGDVYLQALVDVDYEWDFSNGGRHTTFYLALGVEFWTWNPPAMPKRFMFGNGVMSDLYTATRNNGPLKGAVSRDVYALNASNQILPVIQVPLPQTYTGKILAVLSMQITTNCGFDSSNRLATAGATARLRSVAWL